jgi:hypothetical protein
MTNTKLDIIFHYDSEVDVLYAHIGKPQKGKVVFDEGGIILRVNPESNEFVGFTITNYMRRVNRGLLKTIPHFEKVELPVYH